jgi:hypothetical protein
VATGTPLGIWTIEDQREAMAAQVRASDAELRARYEPGGTA